MKPEDMDELKLQLDVLAGLAADLDEENTHVLGVIENIFHKIKWFPIAEKAVGSMLGEGIRIAGEVSSAPELFGGNYDKLCSLIDGITRKLEAVIEECDFIEDSGEEKETFPASVETQSAHVNETTSVAAASTLSAPEIMTEEDAAEFQSQLEVLDSIVEDLVDGSDHVINVVGDMFHKIQILKSASAFQKEAAAAGAEFARKIVYGEIGFEEGAAHIRRSVVILKTGRDEEVVAAPQKPAPKSGVEFDDQSAIFRAFLQQHIAGMDELEESILSFEKGNLEGHADIKRYIHNMKGECGVLGLADMQAFLHNLESAIVDPQYLLADMDRISALLSIKDFISEHLTELQADPAASLESVSASELLEGLGYAGEQEAPPPPLPPAPKKTAEKKTVEKKGISLSFDANNPELMDFVTETNEYLADAEIAMMSLERDPENSESLNEVFRIFHNVKGISGFLNLRDVNELSHNAENLLDKARDGLLPFTGDYSTAAFEALDMLKAMVENVNSAFHGEPYHSPVGFRDLVDNIKVLAASDAGVAPKAKQRQPKVSVSDLLKEVGLADVEKVDDGDDEQEARSQADRGAVGDKKSKVDGMVKITTSRLDHLIDAVGELVIANAMVTQEEEIRKSRNTRLNKNISLLAKITRELQELAVSMRMVSLHSTFHKMTRVARDLSIKSGNKVDFIISGEDTELDRNVVEEIGSPLVHMVRNAMDHGIEAPDVREKAGKNRAGRVRLSAYHEGGNVVIRLDDDGKGLDKNAILQKAIKHGIVKENADLSDKEIYNLIFHAGLSTAQKVTDVSGRGVGMDVVRKSIDKLRGRIDIESKLGEGSSFFIRLPLTLAIIDGMVVLVGDKRYIIPTITINESIRPTPEQVKTVIGRGEMLKLREELMPLFRLYSLFDHAGAKESPQEALLVIVTGDGKKCAIMVDELVGQQQVVIKSLGKTFDNVQGLSGGAIMGDGKVALILDTAGLVRLAHQS